MDHQRESKGHSQADYRRERKEHSQADQAGEVRFGAFDPLSGQNGAPERERKRDPQRVLVWVQEH